MQSSLAMSPGPHPPRPATGMGCCVLQAPGPVRNLVARPESTSSIRLGWNEAAAGAGCTIQSVSAGSAIRERGQIEGVQATLKDGKGVWGGRAIVLHGAAEICATHQCGVTARLPLNPKL